MDSQVVMDQIGRSTLMSVGARTFVADTEFLMFQVGRQTKNLMFKIEVRLNYMDLYDVKLYEMNPSNGYAIMYTRDMEDIGCEQLASAIRELCENTL